MNMAKPFGYVKKRKVNSNEIENKSKKQKVVDNEPKVVKNELDNYLPNKSKKNKYFLLAHPEIIKESKQALD
jgi:hypothetical protein